MRVRNRPAAAGGRVPRGRSAARARRARLCTAAIAGAAVMTMAALSATSGAQAIASDQPSSANGVNRSDLHDPIAPTNRESGAGVNVTVGKGLLVATDPSGKPQLNELISGTQISGTGSASITVPMGSPSVKSRNSFSNPQMDGDSILYNVQNAGAQQQLFQATNSSYDDKLPIDVHVDAWLNDQPIDPAELANVSGHVKVRYTFTNTTTQNTPVTYRDPQGRTVTTTQPVPTPYGGAFSVTLPSDFANINAPWAQAGMNSAGTSIGGSLMLFPPVGDTTQTLTIEAEASDGTWPGAQVEAFPVNLDKDSSFGKLAFKYGGEAENIAGRVVNAGVTAQADLARYQILLMYYRGIVERIDNGLVKPMLDGFQVDSSKIQQIINGLVPLNDNAKQLGDALPQAAEAVDGVNTNLQTGYAQLQSIERQVLAFTSNKLPGYNRMVQQANSFIPDSGLGTIVNNLQHFPQWFSQAAQVCAATGLGSASPEQLFYNLFIYPADSVPYITGPNPPYGTGSIDAAVAALPAGSAKTGLQQMQRAYYDLLTTSAIEALVADGYGKYWLQDPGSFVDGVGAVMGTGCPEVTGNSTLTQLATELQNPTNLRYLHEAQQALAQLPGMASELASWTTRSQGLSQEFQQINSKISNSDCAQTSTGIKQCGAIQQLAYLEAGLASGGNEVNSELVPGTQKLAANAPKAQHYFNLAQQYEPQIAHEVQTAPGQISSYASELGAYLGEAASGVGTIASAQETAARTIAMVKIMDDRVNAGAGMPAGPATGANTQLAAYEYQITGATNSKVALIRALVGLVLLLFAAATASYISRHRRLAGRNAGQVARGGQTGATQAGSGQAPGMDRSRNGHPRRLQIVVAVVVGLISIVLPVAVAASGQAAGSASGSTGLDVTVGKNVIVAADPSGQPDVQQLQSYTQATGNGSANVSVPMDTSDPKSNTSFAAPTTFGDSVVYHLNGAGGAQAVQQAVNNSYDAALPITVKVEATLNGKSINPADMVNITGDVKVSYTITNATAKPTVVTYRNAQGEMVTTTEQVPMPFGTEFEVTLPQGFADIDAPWASAAVSAQGLTPTGTSIVGDLMLFPPVGATTQTLTVQARAANATWPQATFTATPITLSTNAEGKLVQQYGPEVSAYAEKAYTGGVTGQADIAKYQALALQYAQKLNTINDTTVKPVVKEIANGGPAVDNAVDSLKKLNSGAEQLADELPAALAGVRTIGSYLKTASTDIAKYKPEVVSAISELQSVNADIQQLNSALQDNSQEILNEINSIFSGTNISDLTDASELLTAVCSYGANTMLYQDPSTGTTWDSVLSNALTALGSGSGSVYANLNQLKSDLDGYGSVSNKANLAGCANLETKIIGPAAGFASQYGASVAPWFNRFLPQMNDLATTFDQLTNQAVTLVRTQLPWVVNALASGSASIKVAQQGLTYALHNVNTQVVPESQLLVSQVPVIERVYGKAREYAPQIESTIAGIPGELDSVAGDLGMFNPIAGTAESLGQQAEDFVNKNLAIMTIMNQRALAGDGIPAGPAKGATTQLASYQYAITGGDTESRQNLIQYGLGMLFLLVGAGVANVIYTRRAK